MAARGQEGGLEAVQLLPHACDTHSPTDTQL
jgi:hypothetical protein